MPKINLNKFESQPSTEVHTRKFVLQKLFLKQFTLVYEVVFLASTYQNLWNTTIELELELEWFYFSK